MVAPVLLLNIDALKKVQQWAIKMIKGLAHSQYIKIFLDIKLVWLFFFCLTSISISHVYIKIIYALAGLYYIYSTVYFVIFI